MSTANPARKPPVPPLTGPAAHTEISLDDGRAFDMVPEAILIVCDGRIVYANGHAARLVSAGAPGRLSRGLALPEALGEAVARKTVTGAVPLAIGEVSLAGNGADPVPAEAHVASLRWRGRPATLIALRDLGRLRAMELDLKARIDELELTKLLLRKSNAKYAEIAAQLHRAKEAADAANRTKSEFLANMSHELRTPLNAIMGFSEVIKDEMFGRLDVPQYVEYARDIYNSGAHLLEIINDILDLSKVEAGRFDLAEEDVDLEEVIAAVCNLIKGRADEKNLSVESRLPVQLPRLHADKRVLKQMLLNLLSNAVKFTPPGGAVRIDAAAEADGGLTIAVRDTGIGIAREHFDKVLAPFGQVDSPLAREHQGTGLGLPLVKAMVELHGGTLVLESEEGRGTTAALSFPASRTVPAVPR